jgi:ERCC4-type nuclease
VTKLINGDVLATTDTGDMIAIERKTPSDLLNSIGDKHIFKQAAGMRNQTPWAYLVVTGTLTATAADKVIADDRVTGWAWNSVQGALLEIQELGVRVVYCTSNKEYEPTVLRLCNRERCKEKVIEPTVSSRIMSPGEALLCSLPGVGWERASKLLNEFDNNSADAISWLTWQNYNVNGVNVEIAGIGNGVKAGVRKALGLRDGYVLDVFPDEKTLAMMNGESK